jgi:glycogen(starch) synthase
MGFTGMRGGGIRSLAGLELQNNRFLESALDRHRPDLVYVWNMGGLSKSMLTTLERSRVPVVFYLSDHWIARGLAADVWMNWWNGPAMGAKKAVRKVVRVSGFRWLLDRFAPTTSPHKLKFRRIYFCSKALRKLTASAGFDVMHGAVIYCPVDTKRFTGEVKPKEQPCKNLLWVGRLAEDKGIFTALKAMKALPADLDVRLNVFGGGDAPYVAELRRYVEENKLPVDFKRAAMHEMPEVYRTHDALLFTSEWAEPFALTPLEAMASGLPVIGTTTGGSRELFRDRDNALTYNAGQPDELAERIQRLVRNSEMRARIAATGQMEVRANYDEPLIVDQIESVLAGDSSVMAVAQINHQRFTTDGSAAMEERLANWCAGFAEDVRKIIPAAVLESGRAGRRLWAWRRGRFADRRGDFPYNDLEFYVFVRGPLLLRERQYRGQLPTSRIDGRKSRLGVRGEDSELPKSPTFSCDDVLPRPRRWASMAFRRRDRNSPIANISARLIEFLCTK